MKYKTAIIFPLLFNFCSHIVAQKGIVIVPVADLVGQPMKSFYKNQPAQVSYRKLPWAAFSTHFEACPRIHQLIYHEIVDIIDQKNDELQIAIPQTFYQTAANSKLHNCYWTLQKNVLPLANLAKNGVDLHKIPHPIHFNKNNEIAHQNTVTLIEPFTDPNFDITFSSGTRFIKAEEQPQKDKVMVHCVHPKTHILQTIALPKTIVYIFHPKTIDDRLTDFLAILRRWAKRNDGIIPYVWGGCSFTNTHHTNQFVTKNEQIRGKALKYYDRPNHTGIPKSGYDCSSIIVRAAQIVGLPYHYKNTFTLAKNLPQIGHHESVKEGDLISIIGHVMVVANTKTHTIIEAHSYDGGHGKVHEIPLHKAFKGIKTFSDLHRAYINKQTLNRLNNEGKFHDLGKDLKLLKFASQWV